MWLKWKLLCDLGIDNQIDVVHVKLLLIFSILDSYVHQPFVLMVMTLQWVAISFL